MNRARATDDAGNCIASQRSMAAYREILRLRVSWSAITAPHVARDAVRLLDRVPTSAPNRARKFVTRLGDRRQGGEG